MQEIIIDATTSIDLNLSINAIDQATINSLKDLNLKPFDEVRLIYKDATIFTGFCIDSRYSTSFGQKNYEYTINSPLWKLTKMQIEKPCTTFLQLFLQEVCNLCGLSLDYQLTVNPLIYIESTNYFNMLKKSVIYTKNYNTRFYVDYQNNKLIYTAKTDGIFPTTKNTLVYEFEYDTEIINQVQWRVA